MRITFEGLNDANQLQYYYLFKLGKLRYDIHSSFHLAKLVSDTQEAEDTALYIAQLMHVHFNEGIKLFKIIDSKLPLDHLLCT